MSDILCYLTSLGSAWQFDRHAHTLTDFATLIVILTDIVTTLTPLTLPLVAKTCQDMTPYVNFAAAHVLHYIAIDVVTHGFTTRGHNPSCK